MRFLHCVLMANFGSFQKILDCHFQSSKNFKNEKSFQSFQNRDNFKVFYFIFSDFIFIIFTFFHIISQTEIIPSRTNSALQTNNLKLRECSGIHVPVIKVFWPLNALLQVSSSYLTSRRPSCLPSTSSPTAHVTQ